MKYFLPMLLIEKQEKRGVNTFCKKGYIMLYNKNANSFSFWKIIEESDDRYGYIVERNNCPRYWKNVINES